MSYSFFKKFSRLIFKGVNFEKKWLDRVLSQSQKDALHEIIVKTDSPLGRKFDRALIVLIVLSILIVIIETIPEVESHYFKIFFVIEWIITIFFTVEYLIRVYVEKNAKRYMFSFFGMVDLLAIIPTYLSTFVFGSQHLLVLRGLRLLRIFRIFKLGQFVEEGGVVFSALKASRNKIFVFVSFIVLMAIIIGSAQYMVEGGRNPEFKSIPHGIYWAIVTLTTVGYGDIAPITPFGRMLATVVMIMGYGVIAVPTGIVTAEISNRVLHLGRMQKQCSNCGELMHVRNAAFCHNCGQDLKHSPDIPVEKVDTPFFDQT
jgi:voltage-gated potassium channel